ncbi:nucleoside-diphosphate kinase [Patescibacteria group bacterium]|nr:nucleoside-diphosphate kinase [Patescibacteria group bacterium]MBU1868140.1 nucleoside-diphosphate kinase [Patescibacteria group bacterium]
MSIRKERTFIAIKSDGIQRHLIGEVIKRFERRGMKLVACKIVVPTAGHLAKQYPDKEWWYRNVGEKTLQSRREKGIDDDRDPVAIGKWVRQMIIGDVQGKPFLAMIWEGAHAVALGRKTAGSTNPLDADVGTIRGDFTVESYEVADHLEHPIRNILHASGSVDEAEKEIAIYFQESEIVNYPLITEEVLYGNDWGKSGNTRLKKTK